ncbi:MAG: GNAT family N-acetyltransferase [Eubacterium sp.]|nr:GNAT family N-acetyltransferase [Eubacterium sp.]
MLLNEYLENPCGNLSIPYWKNENIRIPENMKIVHNNDFKDSYLLDYSDEKYFRLIHHLNHIERSTVEGFTVKTAEISDIPAIVEIINKSYTDLSVSYEQILSFTKTKVYNKDLWILVIEHKTNKIIGCGIADFDAEAKEGILEWIQVLPEYRGRKIGKMIVNKLLCRMDKANFATVSGKTDNPTNPEKLYRSCGFVGNDIWHILTQKH